MAGALRAAIVAPSFAVAGHACTLAPTTRLAAAACALQSWDSDWRRSGSGARRAAVGRCSDVHAGRRRSTSVIVAAPINDRIDCSRFSMYLL